MTNYKQNMAELNSAIAKEKRGDYEENEVISQDNVSNTKRAILVLWIIMGLNFLLQYLKL